VPGQLEARQELCGFVGPPAQHLELAEQVGGLVPQPDGVGDDDDQAQEGHTAEDPYPEHEPNANRTGEVLRAAPQPRPGGTSRAGRRGPPRPAGAGARWPTPWTPPAA